MIRENICGMIRSCRVTHLRTIASIAGVVGLALAFGVGAHTSRITVPTTSSAAAVRPDAKSETMQGTTRRVEVEILTVGLNGFEPSLITRSAGLFLLAIDNRAEIENLALRLNRVNRLQDGPLLDVTIPRERLNLDEYLNLAPGNYALTEANHPDWVCQITITAQ